MHVDYTLYLQLGPWSYGSWIYCYLCNHCLSPRMLWVRTQLKQGLLDTTLCNNVCQWLAAGWWFSSDTLVSPTNKPDRYNIAEILLKVALNTKTLTQRLLSMLCKKSWHWVSVLLGILYLFLAYSWSVIIHLYILILSITYCVARVNCKKQCH